nr:hypothetical protein GCM10020092_048080 [Actinoplanes digitatis]
MRAFLAGVTDPDSRYFYLRVVARVPSAEIWLERAAQADRDTLALLAYGYRLIAWAWEARGTGGSSSVSGGQARTFGERLLRAEACLGEVVDRNPGDADAWAGLLTCNRGLGRGLDVAWHRFGRARAASPAHLGAHASMLQQLCGKWGGDDREMLRFAVESASGAPEGSPVACLVPEAHLEIWAGGAGQRHIRLARGDRGDPQGRRVGAGQPRLPAVPRRRGGAQPVRTRLHRRGAAVRGRAALRRGRATGWWATSGRAPRTSGRSRSSTCPTCARGARPGGRRRRSVNNPCTIMSTAINI